MQANIDNGKKVLRDLIDRIDEDNTTSEWQEVDWTGAIEDEMGILHENIKGDYDLCDLLAYVLSRYDGDPTYTARVACYGLAYTIADAIICSREFGEECYLLQ